MIISGARSNVVTLFVVTVRTWLTSVVRRTSRSLVSSRSTFPHESSAIRRYCDARACGARPSSPTRAAIPGAARSRTACSAIGEHRHVQRALDHLVEVARPRIPLLTMRRIASGMSRSKTTMPSRASLRPAGATVGPWDRSRSRSAVDGGSWCAWLRRYSITFRWFGFPHRETPACRRHAAAGATYRRGMPIALAYALALVPFVALSAGLFRLTRP